MGQVQAPVILIAEDDNDINHMLTELLGSRGYQTQSAFSGTEALLYIERNAPAAVVLDLMLPGMTGQELLARIREIDAGIVVVVASARDDVCTRVELLRAGADDYVVKPFDTEELLARIEAVLRRKGQGKRHGGGDERLVYKDIVMRLDDFGITVSGQEVALTKREYRILELLVRNPGKVFTRNNIYESVWNEEYLGEDNAVNVHISNIRQKLARANSGETYIQTVWGIGFKMKL